MTRVSIILACLALAAQPAQASPRSIDEITEVDQLGYQCIDPKYLEEGDEGTAAIAFSLSGKVRMPRTCLPEPCARALTQAELSEITGTEMILPAFQKQWDDYYTRYADYCRKEVVPFDAEGVDPRMSTDDFWAPVVSPPIVVDDRMMAFKEPKAGIPIRPPSGAPLQLPDLSHLFSRPIAQANGLGGEPNVVRCEASVDQRSAWVYYDNGSTAACRAGGGIASGGSGGPPPLAPVPLPAGIILLLSGLGVLGALRRLR